MNLTFRKLSVEDLDTIIDMRINQLIDEGANPTFDLKPQLLEFYTRHLNDNSYISWLALDGNKIVATSGISFVEKPPWYKNPTGKIGIISSMYTVKEYRRRGIAKELLHRIVMEAKNHGCGTVHITASNMGVLLYSNYGFKKNGNFMQYDFY